LLRYSLALLAAEEKKSLLPGAESTIAIDDN
jgi:hypothetical protein